ncbi:hypothetical protein E2C06_31055 [Dankookia rubra]|uniref:Uncharacterized protein n=1 Tax=Dankookia rubra TaxID=1442381 RepID=A0A4R5Q8E4_9PROT|nr:hypothetical protein [Dankookia rubra]TDH58728.1 hypothetical protein E2C06_31055 [Dankookia rubra]
MSVTSKSVADLTLERVNRLTQAVADMMDAHAAQGRQLLAALDRVERRLGAVEGEVRALAQEHALLGNRVEEAVSRALRAHIRLDDLEDQSRPGEGLGQ